jgi:putative membrane protein
MKSKLTVTSRLSVLTLMLVSLCFAGLALAQESPTSKSSSLNERDKTSMKKAAKGGMMEIALGRLAEQNGQSAELKSFGSRMVTDHSKANDELKSIAAKKGVKLPSKEPSEKWSSDKV